MILLVNMFVFPPKRKIQQFVGCDSLKKEATKSCYDAADKLHTPSIHCILNEKHG